MKFDRWTSQLRERASVEQALRRAIPGRSADVRASQLCVFPSRFKRFPATMAEKTIRSSDQAVGVQLTESDIPGAFLSEPMASHTVPQLTWWLLVFLFLGAFH